MEASPEELAARVRPPDARASRAQPLLQALDDALVALDRAVHRVVPPAFNPLVHSGAVADTALVIATVSGILLLFWYVPSVHRAYDSVLAMGQAPLGAGLVRSLHRYSSDAAMFMVGVHTLKMLFARRFAGARWLAWVTGVVAVAVMWLVGWTGYWLVWDEAGQQVALGTARLLDVLPLFADPLSRGFLTDEHVNSLLFFVVFFFHMIVPLAMVVALWLHVARQSRPALFTSRPMTLWVTGALVLLSLALPADQGDRARMLVTPDGFPLDTWYLAPLLLTDRLGAGALWSLLLVGGPLALGVPWWLRRPGPRPEPAESVETRCNACNQCYIDCPYDAIDMVPRSDDLPFPAVSHVDPSLCVACGICAGSCSSAGIGLPWLDLRDERKLLSERVEAAVAAGEEPQVALVCESSAGGRLSVDPTTGRAPELPGYLVRSYPCAGWVQAQTVERCLRSGARGVLVVACEPGNCANREGGQWTDERMRGERSPAFGTRRYDAGRVRVVHLGRPGLRALKEAGRRFRAGEPERRVYRPALTVAAGVVVAAALALGAWGLTRVSYHVPVAEVPQLIVSFKHPGALEEQCRERTPEELEAMPVHMRSPLDCNRERAPVRLRVAVDGQVVHERAYPPRGLWKDGNSVAIVRVPVPAGSHRVDVAMGDTHDRTEWGRSDSRTVALAPHHRTVVLFDRLDGFTWYPGE